jgi:hypothetical protein
MCQTKDALDHFGCDVIWGKYFSSRFISLFLQSFLQTCDTSAGLRSREILCPPNSIGLSEVPFLCLCDYRKTSWCSVTSIKYVEHLERYNFFLFLF